VIDVGFLHNLKANRIAVRPNISRFVSDGVVYNDGREEAFDAVIFATGFTTGLASFIKIPGLLDESGRPRFASGRPTSEPGLYFIGFLQSNRGVLYEMEIDSRRLAATIATRKGRKPGLQQAPGSAINDRRSMSTKTSTR
jgi:hypothetical protein